MQGKGKHILEVGESSTHQYKWTARMSRRSYMTEWLQRLDESESVGPPSSDEMCSPTAQFDPPSGPSPIEAEQETMDPLKSEPVEGEPQLLQFDQLQQEMNWMGEFNKNTLGSRDVPLRPDQAEDLDPLQYIQEPPEENLKENRIEELEEDPEERPQDLNPAGELRGKNQAELEGEPAGAEAEVDGDDEEENEEENEDEQNADEEDDEDAEEDDEAGDDDNDDTNEDENDDENEGEDNEDEDDDEDEDGEASDEDVGTASPASTVTTV